MLDPDEYIELGELVRDYKEAEGRKQFTAFEKRFMSDTETRLLEYGIRMIVTHKQWEVIKQISEKVYAIG